MAVKWNEKNGKRAEERATDVEHFDGLGDARIQNEETEDNANSAEHGENGENGDVLEIIDG